jgi:hypothetical protein
MAAKAGRKANGQFKKGHGRSKGRKGKRSKSVSKGTLKFIKKLLKK